MEKIVSTVIVTLGMIIVLVSVICCKDVPNDADYYFFNGSLGKVIEGSIRDDGCFSMETIVYRDVRRYEVHDNYILAYQEPDIVECDYRHISYSSDDDSVYWTHYDDSVNKLLDKVSELHDCYWIIQKSSQKVYGPLNEKEYRNLCVKLDVKKKNEKYKHIKVYNVGR